MVTVTVRARCALGEVVRTTAFPLLLLIVLCGWLCPPALAAQETVNQASIGGRVTDEQGGVVPGALVRARHLETNTTAEIETGTDGRFRFPYLKPGPYEVTVHLDGFADATRTLTLTVGAAFDLPVILRVAGLDTSVTVTAQAPVLESARTQIAGTVSQTEARGLPLNGRNFLDLALLIPGVSPTNTGSTQLFAETSAVPGQGLSIGSQRNLSNSFIVDGLSANDDAAGLSGIPYAVDAVDQFQVVTSGGQAELSWNSRSTIRSRASTCSTRNTRSSSARRPLRQNAKGRLVGGLCVIGLSRRARKRPPAAARRQKGWRRSFRAWRPRGCGRCAWPDTSPRRRA